MRKFKFCVSPLVKRYPGRSLENLEILVLLFNKALNKNSFFFVGLKDYLFSYYFQLLRPYFCSNLEVVLLPRESNCTGENPYLVDNSFSGQPTDVVA